ncbi:MAG: uroporphyrinogen decarboxylase family protein, partial [Candidatus Eisenbacteria bacterium]
SRSFMTPEELKRWSRPYDLRVLAAAGATPYHTMHICKGDALVSEFADYPVGAFSWDAGSPGNPSLSEGLASLPGAVMGGIAHEGALQASDPEEALQSYRRAFRETGGRRWLFAPGCSMPPQTPERTLAALVDEVRRTPVPSGRDA